MRPERAGVLKVRLLETRLLDTVSGVSTVELAVREVKRLSDRQARELLGWLAKRQATGTSLKQPRRTPPRGSKARRSLQKLMAWHDSVRGTTDWQPPLKSDRDKPRAGRIHQVVAGIVNELLTPAPSRNSDRAGGDAPRSRGFHPPVRGKQNGTGSV